MQIDKLTTRMHWRINITKEEEESIHKERETIERARMEAIERATESAAVNGNMWNSLGSREETAQQIKVSTPSEKQEFFWGLIELTFWTNILLLAADYRT